MKQEKVEETDDVTVYDPGVPSSLEQMIFMPQQYQRGEWDWRRTAALLSVSSIYILLAVCI